MTIQFKKAVIIFIFLLSIICILIFQNYSLKGEFYNVLLISDQEDITVESLTKTIFNNLKDINSSSEIATYYTSVNTTYLQVKNNKDFSSKIVDQMSANDMFVVIGDEYNESIKSVASEHLDKKFVLIESNLDYSSDNIYKINFDWGAISNKIGIYLEEERQKLIDSKELSKQEKLKIGFLLDEDKTNTKTLAFNNTLKDLNIEIKYLNISSPDFSQELEQAYKENEILYYVNLNFDNQEAIIKEMVNLQKDNVYSYYKQQAESEEDAQVDTDSTDNTDPTDEKENESTEEELKLMPINYISVYSSDISNGEYDDINQGENIVENILVNTFKYDLISIFEKIIVDENYKNNTEISVEEGNLVIEKIA